MIDDRIDWYAILGDTAMIALAEQFGGSRLYVPERINADHAIVQAIGIDAATTLAERSGGTAIRVPLARELRATHYRSQGDSNGRIARKLGITESGVERLFKRTAC